MTLQTGFMWLLRLVVVVGSAAISICVVLAMKSGLAHVWPPRGTLSQLIPALMVPWGVVLFALLIEKIGNVVERDAPPAM